MPIPIETRMYRCPCGCSLGPTESCACFLHYQALVELVRRFIDRCHPASIGRYNTHHVDVDLLEEMRQSVKEDERRGP